MTLIDLIISTIQLVAAPQKKKKKKKKRRAETQFELP